MDIFTTCTDHFVIRILVEPCDEKCSVFCPSFVDRAVDIALFEDINAPFLGFELSEEIFIIGASCCQSYQFRHQIVYW